MTKYLRSMNNRTKLLFICLLIFVVVIIGRLAYLQIIRGGYLTDRLYGQVRDLLDVKNPRGGIFDANGKELAVSLMTKSLYANCYELKRIKNFDADKMAKDLGKILNKDPKNLKALLTSDKGFIWIERALDNSIYLEVENYMKTNKIYDYCGLYFIEESKRYYPNDSLAAQVLGFVGIDDDGLAGLEYQFDDVLKGEISQQRVSTDQRGTPILGSTIDYEPLKQGKKIFLTLDSKMQFVVEQAMDKSLAATKATAMAVIIMDPINGEILAMASRPTFNPNLFSKATQQQLLNRVTGMVYEPGSTFKPLITAAALNEGLLKPTEMFSDSGHITIDGRTLQNWDSGSWGEMNFIRAFGQSINTIFVQVGQRVGRQRAASYVDKFGFGKKTGVDLPGEEQGILFDLKDMTNSDLASISIGQGMAVTPIQLITATAAMCNGGTTIKPHIVKKILNGDGSVFREEQTFTGTKILNNEAAQGMALLFEKDVSEGGGSKAAVSGYHFGGKTGTAEKLAITGGYASGHYISSFVGFGPVESPKYIGLIVIDDPQGVYYGGQISAPVFAEIMTQVMRYSGVAQNVPTKKTDIPQRKSASTSNQANAAAPRIIPPGKILVPNVVGATIRAAGEQVTKTGLNFAVSGSGFVVSQSIPAFTIVDKGTLITVVAK
ncbi:MAG: penicillin-binding transpeptidase domain-containing protein [Bacillota bacterium]